MNCNESGENCSNGDSGESTTMPRINRMFRRSKKPSRLVIIRSAAKLGRKFSRKQSQNNNQPDAEVGGSPSQTNCKRRNSVDDAGGSFSNNGFQKEDDVV